MLGAIYIGLSGMTAYSKGLQTISNNVANMNTLGFKENSVSFKDMFSGGSGGGLSFQSTDTRRQGAGVGIGGTLIDYSQGDLRQTEGELDLAIQGNGFLVLQNGDKTYYARTGQFAVDPEGYITLQGTDYRLTVLDGSNHPVPVNVDVKRTGTPAVTTKVQFADNLSSTATTASVSDIAVYDAAGGKHVWSAAFVPVGAGSPGEWTLTVKDENSVTLQTSTLKFNGSVVDPTTSTVNVSMTPAGAPAFSVALDFSKVTSFSGGTSSTLRAGSVDGHGLGALSTVTIDDQGQIKLAYSNGESEELGAVALADFRDPQKLQRVGSGLFENHGTGEVRLLPSGSQGIGKLVSKQLEASNVDLAQEFGDLILIQRGFQASSQVVSVSNDMIQQLFGIRGQG